MMTSSRPYLLRAFYEWIMDNDFTPYLVLNAEFPGINIPREYVENGRIVLNIAPHAVKNLLVTNDHVEFNARFGGVPHSIYAPVKAVEAIYAKENGRGMVFKDEDDEETPPPSKSEGGQGSGKGGKGKSGRPNLTIVK